jgi:hypothetical protein
MKNFKYEMQIATIFVQSPKRRLGDKKEMYKHFFFAVEKLPSFF